MNLIEFVKMFDSNIIFSTNEDYTQSENELFYIKNGNVYKTNLNDLDFSGRSNIFVWNINMILKGNDITYNLYKNTIINEKRTIKAILNYGDRL